MRDSRSFFVLLPYLYGLVGLSRYQTSPRLVKRRAQNPRLGLDQRTRLYFGLRTLKAVPCIIIPKVNRSIVRSRYHNAIFLDRHGIPNAPIFRMMLHPLEKLAILALPFPNRAIGTGTHKGALPAGRIGQRTNALGVMRESRKTLAGGQIP